MRRWGGYKKHGWGGMGLGCSSTSHEVTTEESREKAEKFRGQLLVALKRIAKKHKDSSQPLDIILQQLPKVESTLQSCRRIFKAADTNRNGTIQVYEFQALTKKLQWKIPDTLVQSIFKEANLKHNGSMSFEEFIVLLTLVWLLQPTGEVPDPSLGNIDGAMETIVLTFLYFDVDGNGYITRDEVLAAVGGEAEIDLTGRHGPVDLGYRLLRDLDWDNDGKLSFPDFVMAFETWADVDDEGSDL